MTIEPIRTEAEYDAALARIETWFENEPRPDSVEAQRFDELTAAIEACEAIHWRIDGGRLPTFAR